MIWFDVCNFFFFSCLQSVDKYTLAKFTHHNWMRPKFLPIFSLVSTWACCRHTCSGQRVKTRISWFWINIRSLTWTYRTAQIYRCTDVCIFPVVYQNVYEFKDRLVCGHIKRYELFVSKVVFCFFISSFTQVVWYWFVWLCGNNLFPGQYVWQPR